MANRAAVHRSVTSMIKGVGLPEIINLRNYTDCVCCRRTNRRPSPTVCLVVVRKAPLAAILFWAREGHENATSVKRMPDIVSQDGDTHTYASLAYGARRKDLAPRVQVLRCRVDGVGQQRLMGLR